MRLLQQVHQAECELAAARADLLGVMEAQGDHHADGHRRISNLIVALTNTSAAGGGEGQNDEDPTPAPRSA
jgi:hypothetical protein